jgi:histidinol phosphatase-like enzyme
MIDMANQVQPVDWNNSWLIGDSDSDLLAGKARHLKVIKIGIEEEVKPFATVPGLCDAVPIILTER